MRSTARVVFVVAIAIWSLATTLPDVALLWHPLASYGFSHVGGVITSLRPGGAAADAGLHTGDRIDLQTMTPNERHRLYGAVYANSPEPGEPLSLTILRGSTRLSIALRSRTLDRTLAENVSNVVLMLSLCAMVLIAAWLVLVRPGMMTWSFYVYALSHAGLSTLLNAYLPVPLFATQFGVVSFLEGTRAAAFAIFAIRFPRDEAPGSKRTIELILLPVGAVLGVLGAYAGIAPTLLGADTASVNAIVAVGDFAAYAVGAVAFATMYLHGSKGDRQRIKWMLVGLVAGFAGSTGFDVIRWLVPGAVSIVLYNTMYSLNVLFPIALAYAIVRHRVIDVSFVVSRAVVYACLTSAILGLFLITHWFFVRVFDSPNVGTIAGIATTVVLGFWLDAIQKRANSFVDSVLFRHRYRARKRVSQLARALAHTNSMDAVAQALVDEPAEALDLASAALFVRREDGFVRRAAVGWGDRDLDRIAETDLTIAYLASQQKPVRFGEKGWQEKGVPTGRAMPLLAVPLFVRRQLNAIVFYSAHAHGEDLDPDETAAIDELADGACAAFDHIEVEELRRKLRSAPESERAELPELILPPILQPANGARASSVRPRTRARFASGAIACCLALYTIATLVPDLTRPWLPLGTAGVSIDNDDFVTRVEPGGGADAAGMHVGDRLDTADPATRIVWGWGGAENSSAPGRTIPAAFFHLGQRHAARLATSAQALSSIDDVLVFSGGVVGIVMMLTALVLVLVRPSLMMWGFFAYALALNPGTSVKFVSALPPAGIVAYTGWTLFALFAGNVGLVIFAVRFPTDSTSRAGRILLWILAAAFVPAGAAYFYYVAVFPLYGITGGTTFTFLTYFITIVPYLLAMAAFVDTYVHATPEDRQRTKWVFAGFAVGVAGLATGLVANDVSLSALAIPPWVSESAGLLAIAIPLSVGYAVIHHRVVDIRFAVSRAFVYGALTTGIVAIFSIVDWFFGHELLASGVSVVVEIALAVAIGAWLHELHHRVDRALDAVFFRHRHLADERLGRVRRGLSFANTRKAIDYAVVSEPVETLQLTSAALFVRSRDGMYVRRFDSGWNAHTSNALHPDDPLMLKLQGSGEPLRLRDAGGTTAVFPLGGERPVVAAPIYSQRRLFGVAFYGPHASGSEVDAGELRSIERLLEAAASAYDHVEATELRKSVERTTPSAASPLDPP